MTPEPWVPKPGEKVAFLMEYGVEPEREVPARPDPVPLLRELVKKLEAAYDSPSSLKQLDLVNTVEKVRAAYPEVFDDGVCPHCGHSPQWHSDLGYYFPCPPPLRLSP